MSNIDFEYLLSVTGGDYQHAGYIAALKQRGKLTVDKAIRVYKALGEPLEHLHESFREGNGEALLDAINYCMSFYNYPIPNWVTEAWKNIYSQWSLGDAQTIDAALGIKRVHFKKIQRQSLAPLIQRYIYDYRKEKATENAPIDDGMFELAAEYISDLFPELAMRKSKAKMLYYSQSNPWK